MKTIFRFLSLALVVAAGAVAGFGQTPAATPDPACADVDGQNALYQPFLDNYTKKSVDQATVDALGKAVESGKSFLEKYGACESVKPQVDFVKPWVPKLEKRIAEIKLAMKFDRFDKAIQAKNYDETFAAGKDILTDRPNELNILVPLGSIGVGQTFAKNYKYDDDSIRYAKTAISLLKGGAKSTKPNGNFGAFEFECAKDDCISDLTFGIAHMTFWGKNDKAGALPFYYEVTQLPGRNKENPLVFEALASYYGEQRTPIGADIAKLIEKQKAAKTDEEKLAVDAEIKPKVALFNGYTERIIDALGRAHKFTKDATRKATIYKSLQDLYKIRTDKTEGMDAFVAALVAKPLPNPTSAVEPIVDPEPTPTTTTGTSTTPPATPATPAKPPTKPVSTVGTKVSAADMGTNASPSETTTAVKAKTAVKKPVVKKKGTR